MLFNSIWMKTFSFLIEHIFLRNMLKRKRKWEFWHCHCCYLLLYFKFFSCSINMLSFFTDYVLLQFYSWYWTSVIHTNTYLFTCMWMSYSYFHIQIYKFIFGLVCIHIHVYLYIIFIFVWIEIISFNIFYYFFLVWARNGLTIIWEYVVRMTSVIYCCRNITKYIFSYI